MQILVLADTHVGPDLARIPAAVWRAADAADAVLHAGDVLTPELLDRLAESAPTHAVLGNNDVAALASVLPHSLEIELGGVRIGMVHDSGATKGRERRMRRRFPDADVVVFGHSHQPVDQLGTDGQRLFNPGSCTQRRRAPFPSFGILECRDGHVAGHRIVDAAA